MLNITLSAIFHPKKFEKRQTRVPENVPPARLFQAEAQKLYSAFRAQAARAANLRQNEKAGNL